MKYTVRKVKWHYKNNSEPGSFYIELGLDPDKDNQNPEHHKIVTLTFDLQDLLELDKIPSEAIELINQILKIEKADLQDWEHLGYELFDKVCDTFWQKEFEIRLL